MEAVTNPPAQRVNWSMYIRVGVVVGAVALLLGFALKITWNQVVRKGIVNHGDYFEVDLKSMSDFDMDQFKGSKIDVPVPFRDLDGKQVLLEGEVPPSGLAISGGTRSFMICYSVARCCFNGPPRVQHFVNCILPPGKRTPECVEPLKAVKVFGTLRINPILQPDGKIESFFQLDAQRIDPA